MSAPFRLSIPLAIYDAMIAHALAERPAECCGLLAGTISDGIGLITEYHPLVNALKSPTEYESEPRSMFAAHKAMRTSGTEVLAVYHSHPTSEPVPSKRDLERSYGEHVVNLIIGLRSTKPVVRGWWLKNGAAIEADWSVASAQQ